ncbi:MAG: hypothetical protein M3281_01425, partial [Chloroflexota bacterium]|nr:hypothetical protein [Chloroflexota bacterium]
MEDGLSHGALTIFPLSGEDRAHPGYTLLQAAVAAGNVEISETASPTVPHLQVTNKAHLPLLILEGEQLLGGRRNRIMNTSVLLPKCLYHLGPVHLLCQVLVGIGRTLQYPGLIPAVPLP